jgi:hypothetical protein
MLGCRDAPKAGPHSSPEASNPCEPRVGEKLGVPFVHVCASDLGVESARFEPFWISAVPLACSKGSHETVRCPSIVALAHPASGESRGPRPIPASMATVIDSEVAHRICTMRFAGRLPTRAERARATDAMGLATMMVVVTDNPPTSFAFRPLAEWVTEVACDTPSVLEPSCGAGTYPTGASSQIPWDAIAACDSRPRFDASAAVALGESCPVSHWDWTAGVLPCAIRSPAGPATRPTVPAFSLDCRPPAPAERHPPDAADVAAFRCVLPNAP